MPSSIQLQDNVSDVDTAKSTGMRVLLASIIPPRNDGGCRILMHRHMVERTPFELHVASSADFANDLLVHTQLRLPYLVNRLRKSRFGPQVGLWIMDYGNFVWPLQQNHDLEEAIQKFQPDVLLTLAETSVSHLALKAAARHKLPLVGLFWDWFPIMKPHYGHRWAQNTLSRRYRDLYSACDLAFCISDGMKEVLGPHPNSHVVYPIAGRHRVSKSASPRKTSKFRMVYVGSVQSFYGRMLSALIERMESEPHLEIIVVGGDADWPVHIVEKARKKGVYLGYLPPEKSAQVLAEADALLVVMSFEKEHELFMRTSFTTKFVDYTTFNKPIILWAPDYCAPMYLVRREGGALPVNNPSTEAVIDALHSVASDPGLRANLVREAHKLSTTTFNPDRLQDIFVSEIQSLKHG